MSALIKSGYDKLLAAFALGLMAVSGGWAWLHQGAIDLIRNHAVTTELSSAAYTPPVLPRTETQPTACLPGPRSSRTAEAGSTRCSRRRSSTTIRWPDLLR